MSSLRHAINLTVALILVVLGWGGFVYFYFITTNWHRGLAVGAAIVGVAGLYWLWEEYVNAGQKSQD